MIPTLIGVSIITFILIHAVPGDPAQMIAGHEASQQAIDMIRAKLGLDQPLYKQYSTYIGNLLKGDLGTSLRSSRPVMDEIMTRFPTTITLTVMAVIIMVAIGLLAGIFSATKPNSTADN